MIEQHILMESDEIAARLEQMAAEIIRRTQDPHRLAIVGIRTAGVFLGKRLAELVRVRLGHSPQFGCLDITLYRDDLYTGLEHPVLGPTDIRFAIEGLDIVLVDDVLFTGRTVRAALNELMDLGRPQRVQLAVLLDRGHRELPIMADIVGKTVDTTKAERIKVLLREDPRYSRDLVVLLRESGITGEMNPLNERHA